MVYECLMPPCNINGCRSYRSVLFVTNNNNHIKLYRVQLTIGKNLANKCSVDNLIIHCFYILISLQIRVQIYN